MSWIEILKKSGVGGGGGGRVVSVSRDKNYLIVRIGDAMVDELGWADKKRVVAFMGAGEHSGRLRLVAGDSGRRLTKQYPAAKCSHVALPPWTGLTAEKHAATVVKTTVIAAIDGFPGTKALELELPSWTRAAPARFEDRPPAPKPEFKAPGLIEKPPAARRA